MAKFKSKKLTESLRELSAEAHDLAEDGGMLTKGEALARLLWKKALGWNEPSEDDEGQRSMIFHEPASWAIQLVYDRLEGKSPQAPSEETERITAAEKVRELAVARINALPSASPDMTKPPSRTPTEPSSAK